MTSKENMEETLWCIAAGILMAIAFLAIMCGDGNQGILNLF